MPDDRSWADAAYIAARVPLLHKVLTSDSPLNCYAHADAPIAAAATSKLRCPKAVDEMATTDFFAALRSAAAANVTECACARQTERDRGRGSAR